MKKILALIVFSLLAETYTVTRVINGDLSAWSTKEAMALEHNKVSFHPTFVLVNGHLCEGAIQAQSKSQQDEIFSDGDEFCGQKVLRSTLVVLPTFDCKEVAFPFWAVDLKDGNKAVFSDGLTACLTKDK